MDQLQEIEKVKDRNILMKLLEEVDKELVLARDNSMSWLEELEFRLVKIGDDYKELIETQQKLNIIRRQFLAEYNSKLSELIKCAKRKPSNSKGLKKGFDERANKKFAKWNLLIDSHVKMLTTIMKKFNLTFIK